MINRETERNYIIAFKEQRVDTSIQTAHHQRMCTPYESLAEDFNEMVFQYCYVAFFSSACPLVPLLALGINFIKKNIDIYKICNYKKFLMLNRSKGIGVYNIIFRVFYYLGLICNISVVLFSNSFLKDLDLHIKFIIMLVFLNFIIFLSFLLNIDTKPSWFKNKTLIESLYSRQYLKMSNYLK